LLGEGEQQVRLGQDIFGNKTAETRGSYIRCFTRTHQRVKHSSLLGPFVIYKVKSYIILAARETHINTNVTQQSKYQEGVFYKGGGGRS
jgi:hypothetical protein